MNSSDQNPRIPLWVFFTTDFALLGAAAFVAAYSARPLSTTAIFGIIACVLAGAGVALVPLVIRFERQKNETLDERQRALESLASTVSASAEQISIATAGLQQITELAQKNLRHAEQLPHRLHEKIAEFQSQVANAGDAEKEELEKELAALRTTETERLESISDRIAKATAEFAKIEVATQKHLSAATEAIGKLALGTASAIGKAQAAAEQALAHARVEAARQIGESAGQNLRALEAARAAALAEVDARAAAAGAALVQRIAHDLTARITDAIAGLEDRLSRRRDPESAAASAPPPAAAPTGTAAPAAPAPAAPSDSPPQAGPVPPDEEPAAPKRPRKSKREEPAADVAATVSSPASRIIAAVDEPAPLPRDAIPEVTPVAPHTREPFTGSSPTAATPSGNGNGVPAGSGPASDRPGKDNSGAAHQPAESAASHKRSPHRVEPVAQPATVGLADAATSPDIVERVLTSDGATRLIVTAYIGIGNRLFIRGDGPGLSWNKGVPLQFVSIGKWRWETNDATGPIRFKLLKNDEQECASLGAQILDPGHQQEITAAF